MLVSSVEALRLAANEFPEERLVLSLRLVGLGESALRAQIRALGQEPAMRRVRSLCFHENGLDNPAFWSWLVEAVFMEWLEELHLDGNLLDNDDLGALASSPMPALKVLNLNGNQLSDAGLRTLAQAPWFPKLRMLDVGVNWVSEAGLAFLLRGDEPLALESLIIGPNMAFVGDGGATLIADCGLLGRLRTLDLTNNQVGDTGAAAIAQSEGFQLVTLALGNDEDVFYMDCASWARNAIGDDGARSLAESPRLRSLRALYLAGNPIGASGLVSLRDSPYLSGIKELDVCAIGD